jgi:hypothetical protein
MWAATKTRLAAAGAFFGDEVAQSVGAHFVEWSRITLDDGAICSSRPDGP